MSRPFKLNKLGGVSLSPFFGCFRAYSFLIAKQGPDLTHKAVCFLHPRNSCMSPVLEEVKALNTSVKVKENTFELHIIIKEKWASPITSLLKVI